MIVPRRSLLAVLALSFALGGCQCGEKISRARATIDVSPASLDFGTVAPGTVVKKQLVITNQGSATLQLSAFTIDADTRKAFSVSAAPEKVDVGATSNVEVTYTAPASDGADGASLVIASDADNAPEARISLAGRTFTSCVAGQATCGGACVDTATSNDHCGGCNKPCVGAQKSCKAGACVCTPTTCVLLGKSCGTAPDGCGGTLTCPSCADGKTCSAGGACVCAGGPTETSCSDGKDDDCDGKIDCADSDCATATACTQPTCYYPSTETRLSDGLGKSGSPVAVHTGNEFGVIWSQATTTAQDYAFSLVSNAGAPVGTPKIVTANAGKVATPPQRLSWTGTEFGIGYSDVRNAGTTGNDAFLLRFSTTGATLGETTVSMQAGLEFPVWSAWNATDKEFGVGWGDGRNNNVTDVYFARVGSGGALVGTEQRVTVGAGGVNYGDATFGGTGFGLVWSDLRSASTQVYFRLISRTGVPQGADVLLSSGASSAYAPKIAWSGTEFGVVWQDGRGTANEIYFARLSAAGALLGTERVTNAVGGSTSPAVIFTGSKYAVAFVNKRSGVNRVYVALLGSDGKKIGQEKLATCNAAAAGSPSLAWSGTDLGLGWTDFRAGATAYDVYFKVFTP